MYTAGQLPMAFNLIIVVEPADILIAHGMLVDSIVFGYDEPPAALGFSLVVAYIFFRCGAVGIVVVHDHSGHNETVGDFAFVDAHGGEKCFQFHQLQLLNKSSELRRVCLVFNTSLNSVLTTGSISKM